jgi:C-terminal processing protease CtpA/Prc
MQSNRFLATVSVCAVLAVAGCQSAPPMPPSEPAAAIKPTGKFADVATAVSEAMRRWHYNPAELRSDGYRAMEKRVAALSDTATSAEDFAKQFNAAWRKDGPFSHVRLDVARSSAADTAAYLDTMKVGGTGAKLEWKDDVAILTVDTMMGSDTIEQINAAYGEITARQSRALIIDLRNNEGGAFAGMPLIGHVIDTPFDAGAFVSQGWARETSRAPTQADLKGVTPWTGESITAFWRDAQDNRLTRIQFQPMAPHYAGPVYVLISGKTASAAEMTADAFKTSGRAVLIGETTEGAMLSQKMYDMPQGLQLSLPIADYYSVKAGRIEGAGVSPDIVVPAPEAMDVAMKTIAGS